MTQSPSIVRIRARRVGIPLREVYVSSMYISTVAYRTIIELETDAGITGLGESLGTEECFALLLRQAKSWIGGKLLDRRARRRQFAGNVFDNRNGRTGWAAFAGLDMAQWDAAAKMHALPLGALFGVHYPAGPVDVVCPLPTAVVPTTTNRSQLRQHMRDRRNARLVVELAQRWQRELGFRSFKYKSAGSSPEWDLTVMTLLREAFGPAVRLRFDPNGAYTTSAATELGRRLQVINPEFLEDPTDDIDGLRAVRQASQLPVASNMSAIQFDQLTNAARQQALDVVLADVYMWGGIDAFLELLAIADALRFEVGVHSLFESGVGTALNLHLAHVLPHPRRANDVGVHWLSDLLIRDAALTVRDGAIATPTGDGLGVDLDHAALERYTLDVKEVT